MSEDPNGNPAGAGPVGKEKELLTNSKAVKCILLGDSAVGKSKLVERFLLDNYKPHQLSTYALTLYDYKFKDTDGSERQIDIWDTAGQERFNSIHASYYYRAHVCIMVFDVTRKVTYKNLDRWYAELQEHCKGVPTILVANKIDVDYKVTSKSFNFAAKHKLPFFFVSASDGTNVVKIFQMAIKTGIKYQAEPKEDFYQEVLDLLGEISLDTKKELESSVKKEEEDQEERRQAAEKA